MRLVFIGLVFSVLAGSLYWYLTRPDPFASPDVLVVGDSQISYGAGKVYLEFFDGLKSRCLKTADATAMPEKLDSWTIGTIGVRSSALHSWVARSEGEKAVICEVDKKWGVNAGVYGIGGEPARRYVQIGQGPNYQFCKAGQSPLETMLAPGHYQPKLLIMAFLGNAADRWAAGTELARSDVQHAMQQIPADLPCIFMTTAPTYSLEINELRQRAQANIKAAFEHNNSRCSFVEEITPLTRNANTGNSDFFTKYKLGIVTDLHHPNVKAARRFFEIKAADICQAIKYQTRAKS